MTAPGVTLIVEFNTPEPCPVDFLGDTADLVYFLSFTYSERYGSDHPLAQAAAVLKRQLRLNLTPLLTFGDARTDDLEEERALERLWQEAGPLDDCCRRVAEAIAMTPKLQELTQEFPDLVERVRELSDMARWAAERGAKVRLTYVL